MSVRATSAVMLFWLLALPAAANESRAPVEAGDGTTCSADASQEADPARAKRTDADKPAIPRGARSDASRPPRWHSFLPGMFR